MDKIAKVMTFIWHNRRPLGFLTGTILVTFGYNDLGVQVVRTMEVI